MVIEAKEVRPKKVQYHLSHGTRKRIERLGAQQKAKGGWQSFLIQIRDKVLIGGGNISLTEEEVKKIDKYAHCCGSLELKECYCTIRQEIREDDEKFEKKQERRAPKRNKR